MTATRATGLFVVLTAVFTWPQVLHPLSIPDNIDSYFNAWRVAWVAHQLPVDPGHLFDANIFHPLTGTLLFSDVVLLECLVALPFLKLGVPVVLVTNLLVFAGFVLSALGMFLLVRDLTKNSVAAVLAAMVFAFAPFRFDHYFHLEMAWAQWMPLSLWMLHRTARTGKLAHGLLTGFFVALQGYSSVYYVIFLASALVLAGPLILWTAAADVRRKALVSLACGGALAIVLLLPYINAYRHAAAVTGGRSRQEALLAYGTGPKHYLAAMPSSVLYGKTLGTIGQHEKKLFPGFLVMALAIIGLLPRWDRVRVAYAIVLAFAVDISFSQRGLLLGWLYDHVFAFRGLRVPPRIGQLMLLAVGVLAAFGLVRVLGWVQRRRSGLVPAVAAAAIGLTALEYLSFPMTLVPVASEPSAVHAWLAAQPRGVVAELPAPGAVAEGVPEVYYQYQSIFHWFPMLNGYSGMYPGPYVEWTAAMKTFPDESAIADLRARGVSYVILHEQYFGPGEYARAVQALASRRDLVGFGPFPDTRGEARAYRLLSVK